MNVSPEEKLTRFIFSKRYFSKKNKTVKYGAFIPPQDSKDLSVYRISSISDANSDTEVWKIGEKYVQQEGRSIKARADLLAKVVYENDLTVIPDTVPHRLHANITPFPLDRITRQIIATKLADVSKLEEISPS